MLRVEVASVVPPDQREALVGVQKAVDGGVAELPAARRLQVLPRGRAVQAAVSYTHLDVYKRQVLANVVKRLKEIHGVALGVASKRLQPAKQPTQSRPLRRHPEPVSYTHLDVYKRQALTSFFAFGYFAGDRTFLADARILRPATHTRYDSRGRLLSEQRTWRWWHAPDMARSAAATVDAFADRFQTVMDGVLADGRVAVPISGGLDSRSTVAAIGRDVPADRLWAYSYGCLLYTS